MFNRLLLLRPYVQTTTLTRSIRRRSDCGYIVVLYCIPIQLLYMQRDALFYNHIEYLPILLLYYYEQRVRRAFVNNNNNMILPYRLNSLCSRDAIIIYVTRRVRLNTYRNTRIIIIYIYIYAITARTTCDFSDSLYTHARAHTCNVYDVNVVIVVVSRIYCLFYLPRCMYLHLHDYVFLSRSYIYIYIHVCSDMYVYYYYCTKCICRLEKSIGAADFLFSCTPAVTPIHLIYYAMRVRFVKMRVL